MKRLLKVVVVALVLGGLANWYVRTRLFAPQPPENATLGVSIDGLGAAFQVVATDLDVPWEVAFLADGGFLVTERPGRLVRLDAGGARLWTMDVPGVEATGEGGLLGLALDPTFESSGLIYLYLTADDANRVERWWVSADGALDGRRVLVDGIPAASFHDGGRLEIGPDGLLYATTGDAGDRSGARMPNALNGKILRMTLDGGPADDASDRIFSIGHRNPQGLAWDDTGRLWSTEHGRSGFGSGFDEVNLIRRGADYGWPEFQGDAVGEGTTAPVLHSGSDHTWAPSGAAWHGGSLFFGGLRGQALYEVRGLPDAPELVVHFFEELGRVRQVRVGPDGMLYVLTSNRDGRGSPREGDDRLVRVDPEGLG